MPVYYESCSIVSFSVCAVFPSCFPFLSIFAFIFPAAELFLLPAKYLRPGIRFYHVFHTAIPHLYIYIFVSEIKQPSVHSAVYERPLFIICYQLFPGTCRVPPAVSKQLLPILCRLCRSCSTDRWKYRREAEISPVLQYISAP